jgi:L-alanine-DL-glutamate epimerase-like enolase superfamily enzyme
MHEAAAARAAGSAVYVASTYDGPVGIAAGVHAAAALAASGFVAPCGLATLALFEGFSDPVRGGAIAVPAGPGLIEGPRAEHGWL